MLSREQSGLQLSSLDVISRGGYSRGGAPDVGAEKVVGEVIIEKGRERRALYNMVKPRNVQLRILSQTPKLPKWRIAILKRPRRNDIPGKTKVELFLETFAELSRMGRPIRKP